MTLPAADTLLLSLKNCSAFLSRTWLSLSEAVKHTVTAFFRSRKSPQLLQTCDVQMA